ncbi:acyl-CoA carboxylase epsilon subunit [Nocardiopsis coralliicola]
MSGADSTVGEGAPVLRIVRGAPSAEELAALVAVVSARAAAAQAAAARGSAARPRSAWRDSARPGPQVRPGPGAWRRSMHPQ